MCRIFAMRSSDAQSAACSLRDAPNSLRKQSCGDREGHIHADGWGVCHYADGEPVVERGTAPASADPAFAAAADRAVGSTVLAHVRWGSHGTVSLPNTHPFTHGPWTFAHNGTMPGSTLDWIEKACDPAFAKLRRGETDSERIFHLLLTQMRGKGLNPDRPAADPQRAAWLVADAVGQLLDWFDRADPAEKVKPLIPGLNLLLTDGSTLVCSRWNRTLHWLRRDGQKDKDACSGVGLAKGGAQSVAIASEPTTDEPWEEVPPGAVVWVGPDLSSGLIPVAR